MAVGDDASPVPEGVVVHVEPAAAAAAPETSLPAQLVESLPSLAAVVPRTATVVRDRRPSAAVAAEDSVPQQ